MYNAMVWPTRAAKSLFIYYGAKSSVAARKEIHNAFPKHFNEYREPFVGGGSIGMTIPRSIPRWINDTNPGVVAVYTAMKERPVEFIREVRALVSDDWRENERTFERLVNDGSMDLAVRFMFLNRFAYNGRVWLEPDATHRTNFSESDGHRFFRSSRLEDAIAVFRNIRISQGDFAPLLLGGDSNTFTFIDAPYIRDLLRGRNYGFYEYTFSTRDHERLKAAIDRSSHQVMLTYDDTPYIRNLYRSPYLITPAEWSYGSNKRGGSACPEIIITNYPR